MRGPDGFLPIDSPRFSTLGTEILQYMKALKWIGGVLVVLFLLGYFVGMPYLREQTKKQSPERIATYTERGFDLQVSYCSPSKKGREIFGGLVPYGEVWRTGANEPTTFTTGTAIELGFESLTEGDQSLQPGTYSLWTVPGPEKWTVIFNREVPDWGVTLSSLGRKTTRNPEADVLSIEVPVLNESEGGSEVIEDFTIEFVTPNGPESLFLRFAWDTVRVLVPIHP